MNLKEDYLKAVNLILTVNEKIKKKEFNKHRLFITLCFLSSNIQICMRTAKITSYVTLILVIEELCKQPYYSLFYKEGDCCETLKGIIEQEKYNNGNEY